VVKHVEIRQNLVIVMRYLHFFRSFLVYLKWILTSPVLGIFRNKTDVFFSPFFWKQPAELFTLTKCAKCQSVARTVAKQ